ncbi:hypothetical protein BGW80DRAFT_1563974 [Lactifluus volemus]|nr:hypothetical protein BGW80DRAFT_1563974 [Lactifluus volemus]
MEMDLRIDGYISQMFGPAGADHYITRLLSGFDYQSLEPTNTPQWPGAFFVTTPTIQTRNVPPFIHINGWPAWLVDYQICSSGTVVPQYVWRPNLLTILPTPVATPMLGNCGMLLDAHVAALVGVCATMRIRIKWPGYNDLDRQIMTRDQTPDRRTITLEKLAKWVARAVCQFLDEAGQINGRDPAWRIGDGTGIKKEDVNLIGLVQVAQGSWEPILQLDRFIEH